MSSSVCVCVNVCIYECVCELLCAYMYVCVSLYSCVSVGHMCMSLCHKADSVPRGKNTFRGPYPTEQVFSY